VNGCGLVLGRKALAVFGSLSALDSLGVNGLYIIGSEKVKEEVTAVLRAIVVVERELAGLLVTQAAVGIASKVVRF
jgi:hypothetical protein